MIKLNRTTEYGLIALKHMSHKTENKDSSVTSAREISDRYSLPFEITAKTLLRMKDYGFIQSEQGARGGYVLKRELAKLSLSEFLNFMEGPQGVVGCCGETKCEYENQCEIKDPMLTLNEKVQKFLATISIADLMAPKTVSTSFILDLPVLNQVQTLNSNATKENKV